MAACTIASKINVTPKGIHLPISKLHSILAAANLLSHNNKNQICYCSEISLKHAAVNCCFSKNLSLFGGNIYFAGDGTNLHKIAVEYYGFVLRYKIMFPAHVS